MMDRWNPDVSQCAPEGAGCFRPIGIVLDGRGRVFVTVDSTADHVGELFLLEKV